MGQKRYSYRPDWYSTDYLSVVPNSVVKSKDLRRVFLVGGAITRPEGDRVYILLYKFFRTGRGRAE